MKFILAIFIFLSSVLSAQEPMRFIVPRDSVNETVYIAISNLDNTLMVMSDMDNLYIIGISFVGGIIEVFVPDLNGRYKISKTALNRLKSTPFNAVFFESEQESFMCLEIETSHYFINRLKVKN